MVQILGIDPGKSGGLAVVTRTELVDGIRMPVMKVGQKDAVDGRALWRWLEGHAIDAVVIEAVHAMPRQGVTSSFQFGRMLGGVEALVMATGAPVHYVSPAKWKRAMGLSSDKADSISAAKLRYGQAADDLLTYKNRDGIAEAALIGAYWLEQ